MGFSGLDRFAYDEKDGVIVFRNPDRAWHYALEDGRKIVVPDGFEASVPVGFRGLTKAAAKSAGLPAYAIYSYLCAYGAVEFFAVGHSEANAILNAALKELGVGWYRRAQSVFAQTIHSGGIWKKHKHPVR